MLSLLIVNSDNLPPTNYDTVFKSASLDTVSYSPPSASLLASGWPTLGSLIDSGKRLVTFMDSSADFTSVPYIIDGMLHGIPVEALLDTLLALTLEFTNIWETAYDVTTSFDCNVNRSNSDTATSMYLINHFLDTLVLGQPAPAISEANQTNAVSGTNSLGEQFSLCVSQQGRNPNFMLVDVRTSPYLMVSPLIFRSSTSMAVDLSSKLLPPLMVSPTPLPPLSRLQYRKAVLHLRQSRAPHRLRLH